MNALSGQRFGRLIVLERAGKNKWNRAMWTCRCDCGKELRVSSNHLISGSTKSCGCLKIQKTKERMANNRLNYKGGISFCKTHNRWYIWCQDKTKVPFARAVYEAKIGIELPDKSVVHHIDLDSSNDKEENLYLFSNHAAHTRYHNIVGEGVSSMLMTC